jgi:hypothetical protein
MSWPSKSAAQRLRIVVLGYLVRGPLGGMAWHHLQYCMGLAALGHDVWFVEDSGDDPWACYDPRRDVTDADPSFGLSFAAATLARVGFAERWAYHDALGGRLLGPAADRLLSVCASAEICLNLSGANVLRPWALDIPVRVYVDTDPVFTQIRNLVEPKRREHALNHTAFFSFGENFGEPCCTIPDDGFAWQPTRQPVVLDAWQVTAAPERGRFTTVMVWESYPARVYGGRTFGMKSASFTGYFDLPAHTHETLELALGGASAPRAELTAKGWELTNPLEPARDPWTYQSYIQNSKAEFSLAKHGYVVSNSGWFSERTLGYLASGRPVIVQETGFSDWLPGVGEGVLSFSTPEEAAACIDEVDRRYALHCRVARDIAATSFAAGDVLTNLIERALTTTATDSTTDWGRADPSNPSPSRSI